MWNDTGRPVDSDLGLPLHTPPKLSGELSLSSIPGQAGQDAAAVTEEDEDREAADAGKFCLFAYIFQNCKKILKWGEWDIMHFLWENFPLTE